MGSGRRKKHPVITVAVILFWFFILLPFIRTFFGESITPTTAYNTFSETEKELSDLIKLENADFPDDFIPVTSQWESSGTNWISNWHIFKPYLESSIYELENLDTKTIFETISTRGSSKKNSSRKNISNAVFWEFIYSTIISDNRERLTNIRTAFGWFQIQNNLSDREILEIFIDFIQEIPYEIPENYYGLYSPSDVLFRNAGDCDSKAVLAALILKEMGYSTAIFYSEKYSHAMLGLNVPSGGVYKELNGNPYYFIEMTAPGWQIGEISPDCADLKYWNILSI